MAEALEKIYYNSDKEFIFLIDEWASSMQWILMKPIVGMMDIC